MFDRGSDISTFIPIIADNKLELHRRTCARKLSLLNVQLVRNHIYALTDEETRFISSTVYISRIDQVKEKLWLPPSEISQMYFPQRAVLVGHFLPSQPADSQSAMRNAEINRSPRWQRKFSRCCADSWLRWQRVVCDDLPRDISREMTRVCHSRCFQLLKGKRSVKSSETTLIESSGESTIPPGDKSSGTPRCVRNASRLSAATSS